MSTTVTLKRPITFEDRQFHTIEIDEPSIGAIEAYEDARADGRSETSAMIAMLAVDSEWPEGAIRKIKASDMVRISEAIAPFVPDQTPSGGPPGASSARTSPTS